MSPSNYQSHKNQEKSLEKVSCVAVNEMMVQREEEGVQEEGEEEQRRFDISKQTRFKLVITHRCSFSAETPGSTGRRHEML